MTIDIDEALGTWPDYNFPPFSQVKQVGHHHHHGGGGVGTHGHTDQSKPPLSPLKKLVNRFCCQC